MTCKTKLALAIAVAITVFAPGMSASDNEAAVRDQIRDATRKFRDLTMDVRIAFADQKQLAIIGKDYGKAYEFKNTKLMFKVPDKVKMTSRAGIVNVTYIITGDIKRVKAGVIKKTDDISREPHKKQTALDVGVVSDSLWTQFNVDYYKKDTYEGHPCHVLRLYLDNSPTKKQYIWVDAADYRLWKREKREADGSLRVRYTYTKHKEYKDAVIVPGEQRVYNKNNKLGGTSVYQNVSVNTGISDSEFK